ncbi:MAG: ricin-type beta-trefoil lectin domain protein [Lewinellaceae bacterium]|nr:ricin-type beta-trefoil lectin domain protein [Lewinellaceae bacterium]
MKKYKKPSKIQTFLLLIMIALFVPALLNAQWDYWHVMEQQYGVAAVSDAKNGGRSLTMQNNDKDFFVSYTGSYVDLVVPGNVNYDHLRIEVRGADGGSRINTALVTPFKTKGGGGALIKGYLKIGTAANEVPPGSTVRMIIGKSGDIHNTVYLECAAGGGGTGIFIKKPDEGSWQTIAVAGGGGGAYSDCCLAQQEGQSASTTTSGVKGATKGGTNGSDANGGGGGLNSSTENGEPKGSWGKYTTGDPEGGGATTSSGKYFGCGFGQESGAMGGGGGGYSGGGCGSSVKGAGGGGSYMNSLWLFFSQFSILSTTNSPMDGYVVFQLTSDAPEIRAIKFAYNTNKCIDDYGSETSNGNNIQTYSCTGNYNQLWYFHPTDRTIHSGLDFGKCLDLSGGNTSNGTNIQLWDCTNDNDNQHWVYNGLFKTIHSSVNSGKCLDAANGSAYPNSNVNIQLWECQYSNNNQKWVIDGATTVSNPANVKHIIPVLAPSVAVASALGNVWGSNIQLWTKDASLSSENWYFDGWAIKMRDHQELCIDLHDSNTDNGNNIQLWGCNDTNAQKWLYDGMNRSIRSVINPGKCMQIELNADSAYGKRSNIDIQDCNGSEAQQFLIQE